MPKFLREVIPLNEVRQFRTAYGWAGGRNKSGGVYKRPKTAREKERSKPMSQDDWDSLRKQPSIVQTKKGHFEKRSTQGVGYSRQWPAKGEQLDELSRNTLINYDVKATEDKKNYPHGSKKRDNRLKGSYRAKDRLKGQYDVAHHRPLSKKNRYWGWDKKRYHAEETELNEVDNITLTVPLFIRMLEFAKEDAKTDMQLHKATENLMAIGGVVDMDSYDKIVKEETLDEITEKKEYKKVQTTRGEEPRTHFAVEIGQRAQHVRDLKSMGIDARHEYSPYSNLSGLSVPKKYEKKVTKHLWGK